MTELPMNHEWFNEGCLYDWTPYESWMVEWKESPKMLLPLKSVEDELTWYDGENGAHESQEISSPQVS